MSEQSGFDAALSATVSRASQDLDLLGTMRFGHFFSDTSAHVAVETVFSTSDTNPFAEIDQESDPTVQVYRTDQSVIVQTQDSDGKFAFGAFRTDHAGVFHIASGQPRTNSRWNRLDRLVYTSGELSRCYLNHADFISISDRVGRSDDLSVSRANGRKRADSSSINRGFPDTGYQPRPSPREAVREMQEQGAVLRSLTMHSRNISFQLRRVAGSTFYSGDSGLFARDVLEPIAAASAARRHLLTGRERRHLDQGVRPLSVALNDEFFDSKADTGLLLEVVSELPNLSSAVFHRNPYLHLVVRDELDGSNFDVVVTEADSIRIYPGYRASQPALARLSLALGERFGANSIGDLEETKLVSVTDLIS